MSADYLSLPLTLLSMLIMGGSLGHIIGRQRGVLQERERVNHGMTIAMSHLLSPALHLLNGWNRGDITEEALAAGIREYAAKKKAKHEGEQQALLGRHSEEGGAREGR